MYIYLYTLRALILAFSLLSGSLLFSEDNSGNFDIDFIKVVKSERKLMLYSNDSVIRLFNISLGLAPKGAKIREGDFRTPEGKYYIESKNQDSDYYLSLKISYPNEKDASFALDNGFSPGGLIMIHGQPNNTEYIGDKIKDWDWTDGCIAVSNNDMDFLWSNIKEFTPIEIMP